MKNNKLNLIYYAKRNGNKVMKPVFKKDEQREDWEMPVFWIVLIILLLCISSKYLPLIMH